MSEALGKLKRAVPGNLRNWAEEYMPMGPGRAATVTRTRVSAPAPPPQAAQPAPSNWQAQRQPTRQPAAHREPMGRQADPRFAPRIAAERARIGAALATVGQLHGQWQALQGGLDSNPAFVLPAGPGRAFNEGAAPVRSRQAGAPAAGSSSAGPDRQAILGGFFDEKRLLSIQAEGLKQASVAPMQSIADVQASLAQVQRDISAAQPTGGVASDIAAAQSEAGNAAQAGSGLAADEAAFKAKLDAVSAAFLKDFAARFQQTSPAASLDLLKKAEAAEEKVFQTAFKRYKEDAEADASFSRTRKPGAASSRFDAEAFLTDEMRARLLDPEVSDAEVDEIANTMRDEVTFAIINQPADSGQMVDLGNRSLEDFKADVAKAMKIKYTRTGWRGEPEEWDPISAEGPCTVVAERMFQDAQARLPNSNSISDDRSTMMVNGMRYTRDERIGGGTQNEAFRYVGEDGTTVVLRAPIEFEVNGEMQPAASRHNVLEELVKHRSATGLDGNGADNVVKLLGVVTTEKRAFGVFEDCAGGDCQGFANGMNGAAQAGLLPPTIQDAIAREMFGEAARGMKHLADRGMTHNDFKTANVFLDANGTVKVGDLGEAAVANPSGLSPGAMAGSPGYAPRQNEQPSLQRDVGMMGSFLDILASNGPNIGRARVQPAGAGAKTRLLNAMFDKDPTKRPTIDAVLLSSYVDDTQAATGGDTPPSDLADVKRALIAYSKKVGAEVEGPIAKIAKANDAIRQSAKAGFKDQAGRQAHAALVEKQNAIIAEQTALIAEINARPDISPLAEAIRAAGVAAEH